jgi:RimJ/RimL family protein N-acetyltransferase
MTAESLRLRWTGEVPALTTDRLVMREVRAEDFPAFAAIWADREVVRYITKEPLGEEDAWSGFLRMAGHWPVMGYGYWGVTERDTGALLGQVGFVDFKRAITPPLKGEPEIGWVFGRQAHGKGYATEAAKAALRWGDDHFKGARMSCIINTPHTASIRVAEKCGFQETGRAVYKGDNIVILHRDAP